MNDLAFDLHGERLGFGYMDRAGTILQGESVNWRGSTGAERSFGFARAN